MGNTTHGYTLTYKKPRKLFTDNSLYDVALNLIKLQSAVMGPPIIVTDIRVVKN